MLRKVGQTADKTTAMLRLNRDFAGCNAEGKIPVWYGLEFLTNTVRMHQEGCGLSPGVFADARNVRYHTGHFLPDVDVKIEVSPLSIKPDLQYFQGRIFDCGTSTCLLEAVLVVDPGLAPFAK